MASTNAGAIRGVHCRPQACQFFAAVRWPSSCRLCAIAGCSPSWWRVWCCGGLPPPGKGPSPAVWGEGLYRLVWVPTWLCGLVGQMSICAAISGVVCAPAPTGAAGSKQCAASPAISSLLLPAPLGRAAAIALNMGVEGGGYSTKAGCRLAGQAERYGTESQVGSLSSRFRALERLLCGLGIAGSREDGDYGRLASKKGWGDDGAWLPAELAAVGGRVRSG